MKTTIQINGKDVEITLTKEQVAQINKQKQLDASTCTLQDCIDYLGEDDLEVVNLRQLQKVDISDRILANQEAVCFNRALNEKHIFDWNNNFEQKWRNWYHLGNGFRFYYSYYGNSDSYVASSLYFKTKKLADSAGSNKNYLTICKRFMY